MNERIYKIDVSNLSPHEIVRVMKEWKERLTFRLKPPESKLPEPPEPLTEDDIMGKRKLDL